MRTWKLNGSTPHKQQKQFEIMQAVQEINPLYPNISMHILTTALCIFLWF